MRNLIAVALIALPLSGCTGLVLNADHQFSANSAQSLGAHVCRIEFAATTPASQLDADLDYLEDRNCKPLLLAGDCGNTPSQAMATNPGTWAARFGPGSAFQAGRDEALAVTSIEFCNETSYRNGAPDGPGSGDDWWASSEYLARAQNYGVRAGQAIFVVTQANNGVDVIVQADHGGSGSPNWVNKMIAAAPALKTATGGWSVHPYGPPPASKVSAVISQTAAAGADADISIDVTEYGISTDNGRTLENNYGWPTDLDYTEAAVALQQGVDAIHNAAGGRLRYLMIYSAHDLRAPGTAGCSPAQGCREWYFGALTNTNGEKGAYSNEVRDQLAE